MKKLGHNWFATVFVVFCLILFTSAGFGDVINCPTTSPKPPCTCEGTSGEDIITGTSGDDVICAGDGDDNDILLGGWGHDFLNGENGNDTLEGGRCNDFQLVGLAGTDTCDGGRGVETFFECEITNPGENQTSDTATKCGTAFEDCAEIFD